MGHCKNIDDKKLLKAIINDGWYLVKQRGGHRQFKHPTKKGKITIPYHISPNIVNSVLKQAGISKKVLDK